MRGRHLLLLILCAGAGCPQGGGTASSGSAVDAGDGGAAATPVSVVRVEQVDLPVTVTGPGRTDAAEQQVVRAPFDGTVVTFSVTEGDRVTGGQVIATMVSRDSEAAITGARELMQSARTASERRDARRALKLAREGMVRAKVRAPEEGVVLSHAVDEGSQVNENDPLAQVVATDSLMFIAQINQQDLTSVAPGQHARVALAALDGSIEGTVHAILPSGSATDLTAPVRIDFAQDAAPPALNLFGVATITVGEHRRATVVPAAAVIRDDVSGISRVATVRPDETVRWVEVETGLASGDRVEILSPSLTAGQPVIENGQVGLPDGARVRDRP